MKNGKGITLIVLVITIIVLLILAGVSISMVVGNNGVLTQASNAVVTNREVKAREEVEMAFASAETEYMAEWAKDASKVRGDYFTAENLTKYTGGTTGTGTVLESTANADGTYTIKYQSNDQGTVYTFTVDSSGKVMSVGSEAGTVTPTTPETTYTVTFNTDGGTSVASQTITSGGTATEPTAPTKEGYIFEGWYSDPEKTTAFDFSTEITGDITLYAVWSQPTVDITFYGNGGTGSMDVKK